MLKKEKVRLKLEMIRKEKKGKKVDFVNLLIEQTNEIPINKLI